MAVTHGAQRPRHNKSLGEEPSTPRNAAIRQKDGS
jgi:hypothetical protein